MPLRAAIDIGTNSVLMLVADVGSSAPTAIAERCTITRLGEGVDKNQCFLDAAVERTLNCLRKYRAELESLGVSDLQAVATSAARDAEGGENFLDTAAAILGVRPVIISGHQEAELTFAGALVGLPISGSVCVFDVGGGSTEIIFADTSQAAPKIIDSFSLDIGSVRLTERFLKCDPPSAEEISQLRTEIRRELASHSVSARVVTIIGVAGTVTTLAALDAGLDSYDAAVVHGHRVSRTALERWSKKLSAMTTATRSQLPGVPARRADVLAAGSWLVSEVLHWLTPNDSTAMLIASDRGVRWGLLCSPRTLLMSPPKR
ncbi:MAG: Ppx/GppA family phosphatase [Polyangiaceae bacterium]|nr:Ppx/GppA family phosphatase [Polyangiaceae bacterium]